MGITVRAPAGMTTGTYAGDDSANKAIPHGLGAKPKVVLIASQSTTIVCVVQDMGASSAITAINVARTGGITALTSTNFYVGNAGSYANTANAAGVSYTWWAFK